MHKISKNDKWIMQTMNTYTTMNKMAVMKNNVTCMLQQHNYITQQ